MTPKITKDARILIVGAGPAGLSHAHFLRKAGYDKVDLLEINGKVGGKSHTLTYEHKSFDLGANYLTPDYKEILKMAKEVGAKTYAEKNPVAFNPETGKFKPLLKAVMEETSFFAFAKSCIRYYLKRWKLNSILPKAGNIGVANHPELMVSFQQWLEDNNLSNLKRLFSIPVTMMGYGTLDKIAAPYVLRYIGLGTFRTMLLFGAKLSVFYPKRFVYGFQRFWQRVSWDLNVQNSIYIKSITRDNGVIHVTYDAKRLEGDGLATDEVEKEYDYLVLSCPLLKSVLEPFLNLSDQEKQMFDDSRIQKNMFGVVLINDANKTPHPYKVFHIFPEAKINQPSIFAHQFLDRPAYEIYSPMTPVENGNMVFIDKIGIAHIKKTAIETIKSFGGTAEEKDILHYDYWSYFYHVSLDDFKNGYFDQLESMQGSNNTFYNMGLNSFELIEPIARYSKHLVEEYYLGDKLR